MLKHKAIELFKDFNKVTNNNCQYDEWIDFSNVLTLAIVTKLKDDNRSLTLVASIYGEYCISDKYFDYSEKGFLAACEWLDNQREKIIVELL